MQFLVASLCNVNDAARNMARSIGFDCLKYREQNQYKFGGKLALCIRFDTFSLMKAKQDRMKCLF